MLTPDYLKHLPDNVVKLWQQVEDDILKDIGRRIAAMDEPYVLTPTAIWQLHRLEQTRALRSSISATLAKYAKRSRQEIKRTISIAGTKALAQDDILYNGMSLDTLPPNDSPELVNLLNSGYMQTLGTFDNLTRTTANTVTQQFERELNRAWLQVTSGAFSYDTAIKRCVDTLAEDMQGVKYPSGHTDTLEVAVRRAVLTGANQTAAKLQLERANEMGCEYVEVSAHSGARTDGSRSPADHAYWQGKVYHIDGDIDFEGEHYEDFVTATGYGTGEGLCGWNCRHNFSPFWPGISVRNYTPEKLEELNARNREYKGKMYTEYEISQMRRGLERDVRKLKRKYIIEQAAGLSTSSTSVAYNEAEQALAIFNRDTAERIDEVRTYTAGFGFDKFKAAGKSAAENYKGWLEQIGAGKSELDTLDKYNTAEYNNSPAYMMLSRYAESVNSGMLSPLAGLDKYIEAYNQIERELIGKRTSNGILIREQAAHLLERVFGTISDPSHDGKARSGVSVDDLIDCLLRGKPGKIKFNSKGEPSQFFSNNVCDATINPETGKIIQCNPN